MGTDYHVQYKKCRYSVHHDYRKKKVDVRGTASGVEIFYKEKRIASHMRLKGIGKLSTHTEHMRPEHLAYKNMPSTVRKWLTSLNGSAEQLNQIMYNQEKQVTLSTRLLTGMMRLEKKFGEESFQKACKYVLFHETSYRYKTVLNTLTHELYDNPEESTDEEEKAVDHSNIRGGKYFG